MTPCEKLGYKVGDKFEVARGQREGFRKGEVITLRRDDGSDCPEFSGNHYDGDGYGFVYLNRLKPLTTPKLRPAKQALANAIHASGKGWPDGANWAVQVSRPPEIFFASGQEKPVRSGNGYRVKSGGLFQLDSVIKCDKLLPNWHQTVLSREEYFQLYQEQGLEDALNEEWPKPTTKPTIEQLAADYRNKLDYANRKQQEADDAKAASDAALGELVAAGEALGLLIAAAKPEPELVITDWRDLQVGDIIEYVDGDIKDKIGMTGPVVEFAPYASDGMYVRLKCDDGPNKGRMGWPRKWRFIRRP